MIGNIPCYLQISSIEFSSSEMKMTKNPDFNFVPPGTFSVCHAGDGTGQTLISSGFGSCTGVAIKSGSTFMLAHFLSAASRSPSLLENLPFEELCNGHVVIFTGETPTDSTKKMIESLSLNLSEKLNQNKLEVVCGSHSVSLDSTTGRLQAIWVKQFIEESKTREIPGWKKLEFSGLDTAKKTIDGPDLAHTTAHG